MKLVIKDIKELVQTTTQSIEKVCGAEMKKVPTIKNAYLIINHEGKIAEFGEMSDYNGNKYNDTPSISAQGKMIFPSFVDSHTHLVYTGSREIEYIDKIKGLSYEEIAKRGGGILNSAKRLQNSSEEELFEQSAKRIEEIIMLGTGAVEIKSGYGLNTNAELKMLRVIKKLKAKYPVIIKSTFLGAHAVPLEYKSNPDKYIEIIINEMLPQIAEEKLADYVDVFCDKGFFTPVQTEKILTAAAKYNILPKIHANELDYSGGVQIGVKHNALSVDHLEYTGDAEIKSLLNSKTMPTILPGASFFLGLIYAPARKMIDSGLPIAMASDYNPGSSPSGNMQFILSLACIKYKLLPEEAINATTINTAYAMGVNAECGSITPGKWANFYITKPIPTYEFMPYAYGSNKIESIFLKGEKQMFFL